MTASTATVRFWRDEDGWGVVDSPDTPGGCWVHFSAVTVAGYRQLRPGQRVELEWESARQDGYDHRAVRVWPAGTQPVDPPAPESGGSAYRSRLTIEFDDPPPA